MGGSAACCDESAINYDAVACADQYVINDGSLCQYVGGGVGDVWVCDPNNVLKLRCVADTSGNIVEGCAAVESPNNFGIIGNAYNDSVNCGNAVPTPEATTIDAIQLGGTVSPQFGGMTIPAYDSADNWGLQPDGSGLNSIGGKGTGCVKVNEAVHNSNVFSVDGPAPLGAGLNTFLFPIVGLPFGSTANQYDDGTTGYGCNYPTNCYSWELASIYAAGNNTGVLSAPPSVQPISLTSGLVNSIASNNVNPVVQLINVYNSIGLPGPTFNNVISCMKDNQGCPSQIINYNY